MLHCNENSLDVVVQFAKRNPKVYVTFSAYAQKTARQRATTRDTLKHGLLSHKENTDVATVRCDELSKKFLLQLCNEHFDSHIAVRSRVHSTLQPSVDECEHNALFIPMLDFSCRITRRNTKFLTELLHQLTLLEMTGGGYLLRTTNSYHYYGVKPLTIKRWVNFIGRSLLLLPCGFRRSRPCVPR